MSNPMIHGARSLTRAIRRKQAVRDRMPPRLRFGDSDTHPRIFYLCPDPPGPAGGVRVLYRHVDLLNAAGFDAMIIHRGPRYRADWFTNQTRIVAAADVVVTPRDTLVVPEFYGAAIASWPLGPTVILFNQGAYYTFDGMSIADARTIMRDRITGILTVSDDSMELLAYAFDGVPVRYASSVIDGQTFHRPSNSTMRRRIAYPMSRRSQERHQLLGILELRGRVNWEMVPIVGMTEAQVGETLRSCAIFLALNEREGFGLPPAEAMACGCYVIGYHGQGAKEYFDPEYCMPIADSDLLAYVRGVEESTTEYDNDPGPLTRRGIAASQAVLDRYHIDRLRNDLIACFTEWACMPNGSSQAITGS